MSKPREARERATCVRVEGELLWRFDDGALYPEILVGADASAWAKHYYPGMFFLCAKRPPDLRSGSRRK